MTDRIEIKESNAMETATNELTQNALTGCGFLNCFSLVLLARCGPGSSVGITSDYGLEDPASNPGGDEIFRPS